MVDVLPLPQERKANHSPSSATLFALCFFLFVWIAGVLLVPYCILSFLFFGQVIPILTLVTYYVASFTFLKPTRQASIRDLFYFDWNEYMHSYQFLIEEGVLESLEPLSKDKKEGGRNLICYHPHGFCFPSFFFC